MRMHTRPAALPLALLLLTLAADGRTADPGALSRVRQVWSSSGVKYGETDSLAVATLPDGRPAVFATAKGADRLDVFDAATGAFVRSIGGKGAGPGQFHYPNGIAAVRLHPEGDPAKPPRELLMIVERDNRRVQALWPDGQPAGMFGGGDLTKPYGCAVSYPAGGVPRLAVTDPDAPPAQRVRVYELRLRGDGVQATHVLAFGDTGKGRVDEAESVLVDDAAGLVFLCDEDDRQHNVKVYRIDGTFTGRTIGDGQIGDDPEGLAFLPGGPNGFLVVTEQTKTLSIWHVFDRRTFAPVGRFTGEPRIANTDGICAYPGPIGAHADGLFFAVNDDKAVCAYSLADIRAALAPQAK